MLKTFSQISNHIPLTICIQYILSVYYLIQFCPNLKEIRTYNDETNELVLFSSHSFIYSWSSSTAVHCRVWKQCDHGMQIPCEWFSRSRTPDCCLGAEKAGMVEIKRGVHISKWEGTPPIPTSWLHRKSITSAQWTEGGTSHPSDHQCEDDRHRIIPLSHWLPGCGLQVHCFRSKRWVVKLNVIVYSLRCLY